jgi:hypothetical protein
MPAVVSNNSAVVSNMPAVVLSRLPPKSVPLLVWAAFGGGRHRSSSHRRSTFHFPFVLSCFPAHLVFISSSLLSVFSPLFPPCLCGVLLFVKVGTLLAGLRRVSFYTRALWPPVLGFCTLCCLLWAFVLWRGCVLYYDCLSKVLCPFISALLRLTSMHQLHPPLTSI